MTRQNAITVLVVILFLSNIFTVVKVLGTASDANATARTLAVSQRNQLANRTANVATWCGAINEGRDYARVLRAQSHQTPYLLPDLDCHALEMGTLQSAR
jgi:hypothetical protein